jgi:phage gp29-like protein
MPILDRVRRRPRTSAPIDLSPVTVPRLEPWLGREMAGDEAIDRFANLFTGPYREDPHPSEILRTRSTPGKPLGHLYDEMLEKDTDLAAYEMKRREAVLALPRFIIPADSSPKALEAADFCRTVLSGIKSLETNFSHQLQSRSYGVRHDELIWERLQRGPLAGAVVPVAIIDRPMHRFLYRRGVLHVRQLAGKDPIPAPPGKFLVARHGTKDQPWGLPLLDKVYWPWFIKKHGWKFYAVFVEKFGQPTAWVKYPNRPMVTVGADGQATRQDLQAKALEIAKAIQTEMAVAIPEGIVLDFLEASRGGDGTYNQFIQLCSRSEAMIYLGEVNTSGLRPGTGSYASDEVADRVSSRKVKLDARDAGAHWKDELFVPLVQLNLGPDYPVPQLLIDHVDAEDRAQRREGLQLLITNRQPIPRRYFYMTAQAPEPRDGEEVVAPWLEPAAAPGATAPPPNLPPAAAAGPPEPEPQAAPPAVAAAAAPAARRELTLQAGEVPRDIAREAAARDADLGAVATTFAGAGLEHHADVQQLVLQAWDEGRFDGRGGLEWLVTRMDTAGAGRALQAAQTHGIGLALRNLIGEGLGPDLWRGPSSGPSSSSLGLIDLPLNGRVAHQVELALAGGYSSADTPETAADFWAELLSIDKTLFEDLADDSRRFAFTVAGVTDARMLVEIQELVGRAKAEGWSRDRFADTLAEIYRRNGMDPTSDWHAQLVFANNVRQAEGAVRYAQVVRNPAAHRLIPYLQWVTVGDDRVRARPDHNHVVMDGEIFATGHEIWRTWWYPAGHGCRCLVATINRRRAERMGLVGAEPTGPWPLADTGRALPDPGFQAAPDLGTAAQDVVFRQLLPILEQAQETGDTSLLAALRQLLDLLGLLGTVRQFFNLGEAA